MRTMSSCSRPRASASSWLMFTMGSGMNWLSQGVWRYLLCTYQGTRLPVVRMSGYCLNRSGVATGLTCGSSYFASPSKPHFSRMPLLNSILPDGVPKPFCSYCLGDHSPADGSG